MVRMKITSGPKKGSEADVTGQDPESFLTIPVQLGLDWEIDFSEATEAEKYEWGWHDIAVRIVRALSRSLPVTFEGRTYTADPKDPEHFSLIVGMVEDAIVQSGKMVTLVRDDASGVFIKAVYSLQ